MAQPERSAQRHIVAFLRQLGATVYVIGTTRRRTDHQGTMQSVGLPDLLAFIPYAHDIKRRGEWLVTLEVKAQRGRLSPAQQIFAAHCAEADVTHLIGGLDVVLDWALAQGFIEGERTHYRIPRRSIA